MIVQSNKSSYELKEMLEKYGFEYIHRDLLYVGSLGIDFHSKSFFPMAISIYPKKTDEEILKMLKEQQ